MNLHGPAKGMLILLVVAGALAVGLLAIQGRFTPRKPAVDKIAFVSNRDGGTDLWLMDLDGSSPRALTQDSNEEANPSWSHDATRILFSSKRDHVDQLFLLEPTREKPARQITIGSGAKLGAVFSPDGSQIAYLSQGKVYIMNSDGSEIEPVLPAGIAAAGGDENTSGNPYIDVDMSADSKSIAAVRQSDVIETPEVLMSPDEDPTLVTDLQGNPMIGQRVRLKWSPTGKRLAVSCAAKGKGVLVVRDYDLDALTFVVTDIATGRPAWSPAGERIAFEVLSYREGHGYSISGLGVAEVESGERKILARGETASPSWTADGKRIVFTKTGKNGQRDIWSISPDGSDPRNLTQGKGDSYDAAVSPVGAQ